MAITLVVTGPNGTTSSQTVASGSSIPVSPGSTVQILVDGRVIDPGLISRNLLPPDLQLTLPDGQSVTLDGFLDIGGTTSGGLVDASGTIAVAATLEDLIAPAAGPGDAVGDGAGANNLSTFNQALLGPLGAAFGSGSAFAGLDPAAVLGAIDDSPDPNEFLASLLTTLGVAAPGLPPPVVPATAPVTATSSTVVPATVTPTGTDTVGTGDGDGDTPVLTLTELFTVSDDTVDLSDTAAVLAQVGLDPADPNALAVLLLAIAAGFNIDDALSGDDDVVLPGLADGLAGLIAVFEAGAGNDTVQSGDAGDTVLGGSENDTLLGGDGDDRLEGNEGDDTVSGEGGNDLLLGDNVPAVSPGDGMDLLYGGAGDDTLGGKSGDDALFGGTESDSLFGDAGNDRLYGGDGMDWVYGGDDADQVYGGNGDDIAEGGDGTDLVYGDDGNATTPNGDDQVYGRVGDDILFGDDGLLGNADFGGNDTLYGGAGEDTAHGELGNDTLFGDDLLGTTSDLLYGGNGEDLLYGDDGRLNVGGNDTLFGGVGNDRLFGEGNTDSLFGGEGDDSLDGGFSADLLVGGSGADTLTGGGGDDTFAFSFTEFSGATSLALADVITDFDPASANETITVNLNGAGGSVIVVQLSDVGGAGSDAVLVLDNGNDGFTAGVDQIIAVLEGADPGSVTIGDEVVITP